MFQRVLAGLAVVFSVLASSAWACSVTQDYVRPTNYELVQMADAIVVARAMRNEGEGVAFATEHALKGDAPAQFVTWGRISRRIAPTDQTRIAVSHPEGHAGPCNRMSFAAGGRYIIFLSRDGDAVHQIGIPFSRVNEDYSGPDALWPRVIRSYADIQAHNEPMEALLFLERLLAQTLAEPPSRDRDERARDITDHLMSRSPWKPTQFLVETFEAMERGEAPRYPLRSPAADREHSDAQAMSDLIFGSRRPAFETPIDEQDFVLRALVLGEHPSAAPLFERLLDTPNLSARRFGFVLWFLAKNGQYPRAYELIETRALTALDGASDVEARSLIRSIQQVQLGDNWTERPRWADYPDIVARWPVFGRRLWDYQINRFGRNTSYPFPDLGLF